jgi:hypothetical protein
MSSIDEEEAAPPQTGAVEGAGASEGNAAIDGAGRRGADGVGA